MSRRTILKNIIAPIITKQSLVTINPNFKPVSNIQPEYIKKWKYQFTCKTNAGTLTWFSQYPIYGISSETGILFILARGSYRSDNTLISENTNSNYYNYVGQANGVDYVTDWSERTYENIISCNFPIYECEIVQNHQGTSIMKTADITKKSESAAPVNIPSCWDYYVCAQSDGVTCLICADSPIYMVYEGAYLKLVFKPNAYMWIGYKCYNVPSSVSLGIKLSKTSESYSGYKSYQKLGYYITEQNFKQIVYNNTDLYYYK